MSERVYSYRPEDKGLVYFLFPERIFYREPLPPFPMGQKLVIFSSVSAYSHLDVIRITHYGGLDLSSQRDFLKFVQEQGIAISDKHIETLSVMDPDEFWKIVKVLWVLRSFREVPVQGHASVFEIFCKMFLSFDEVYRIYRVSVVHYKVIVSALLTMMVKAKDPSVPGISPGYKRVLLQNKVYIPVFQRALLHYLDSEMMEMDFLEFLHALSQKSF